MISTEKLYLIGLVFVFILFILAVIDINKNVYKGNKRSVYWIWLLVFFPIVGPIIYFLMRNKLT
ncbi:PLDc N-terminal domain-containing protein [Litoribacter populi]|uniref:PLDc N-terminal domain-containing protein n=1 Tax=Litoribacter populi TaxID=2598460 RepID=UPI00163D5D04